MLLLISFSNNPHKEIQGLLTNRSSYFLDPTSRVARTRGLSNEISRSHQKLEGQSEAGELREQTRKKDK